MQNVPKDFAKQNGLDKGSQEILLMNEQGKSWESEVKSMRSGQVFIFRGWTSFCTPNRLQVGDPCTFKLLPSTGTPVFQLCSRTKDAPEENDLDKTGENRFVKLIPSPNSLASGQQVTFWEPLSRVS